MGQILNLQQHIFDTFPPFHPLSLFTPSNIANRHFSDYFLIPLEEDVMITNGRLLL